MPERIVQLEKDSIYHIYNRGVNKLPVFYSSRNFQFFLTKLGEYIGKSARLYAYCLMPNHFHLLLRINSDDFVKKSLQSFLITYTKSINHDQTRVGPLFQGRFQANLIGNDEYLLDCVKYIHLNPVKAGLVTSPREWEYSSYRTYLSRNTKTIVDIYEVYQYFSSIKEFREYSEFGIDNYQSKYLNDFE
jgi:putative transposase